MHIPAPPSVRLLPPSKLHVLIRPSRSHTSTVPETSPGHATWTCRSQPLVASLQKPLPARKAPSSIRSSVSSVRHRHTWIVPHLPWLIHVSPGALRTWSTPSCASQALHGRVSPPPGDAPSSHVVACAHVFVSNTRRVRMRHTATSPCWSPETRKPPVGSKQAHCTAASHPRSTCDGAPLPTCIVGDVRFGAGGRDAGAARTHHPRTTSACAAGRRRRRRRGVLDARVLPRRSQRRGIRRGRRGGRRRVRLGLRRHQRRRR
mmetsp:Transcript_6450/g.40307  ORF Transcript_6450/g.40307 Transcript_6450/m.40307 type:complete len:261 (+) Transcript_6450:839-1621(+)